MRSDNDLDVPNPEFWFRCLTDTFATILLLSSIFTLILYFSERFSSQIRRAQQEWALRQRRRAPQPLLAGEVPGQGEGPEKVEQVMGSITFCYCCSNLILAFLWFQIFDSSVSEDYGDFMAFITLFCLFNCSFYQMSFKYYFWCYFQHKKALQEIGENYQRNPRIDLEGFGEPRQGDQPPEIPLEPSLRETIKKLENRCGELEKKLNEDGQTILGNYRDLERLERSVIETTINSKAPLLISMNSKINALVNICSFSLTARPTLAGNLGCGYLGDWSVQYKPEIQTDEVIFYLLMITGDIILAALTLVELNGRDESYNGRLQALEQRENLTVAEKQERYYLRHIRGFIVVMTILNLVFLSVNIYASRATENVPHRWTHGLWKGLSLAHFASPAIQSFFLFLLKYFEPIPRGC